MGPLQVRMQEAQLLPAPQSAGGWGGESLFPDDEPVLKLSAQVALIFLLSPLFVES